MRMNDPVIPTKDLLFGPEEDAYGIRLALVFGNESFQGKCPFYEKQCFHCDIGKGEGMQFTHAMNRERIDFFKSYYRAVLPKVVHLVIYNSGSILNPKEMSKKTLDCILEFITTMKRCRIVSFDSREIFIRENKLQHILGSLRNDQRIRTILGIESQREAIRIGMLNKMMTSRAIAEALETISKFHGQIGAEMNIIFQPPGLTGKEAIQEVMNTVQYGLRLSRQYGVPVDFNLHPYYRSSIGISKYPNHYGPALKDVIAIAILVKKLIARENITSHVYIGCNREGHDQEQKREEDLSKHLPKIHKINVS